MNLNFSLLVLSVIVLFLKSYDFAPSTTQSAETNLPENKTSIRKDDEYYCRYDKESYKICRRCQTLDEDCPVIQEDCLCDNIAILNNGIFRGGADCLINDYGDYDGCYVGEDSPCGDKVLSTYASSEERGDIWYPKKDGKANIYISVEACENMQRTNEVGTDIGNEEILHNVTITKHFLLDPEKWNEMQVEEKIKIDFSGPDYEGINPKYDLCKNECISRNEGKGKKSGL